MSTKNFVIVLLVFCVYVLLGAMIFYGTESAEERTRIIHEEEQRKQVKGMNYFNIEHQHENFQFQM